MTSEMINEPFCGYAVIYKEPRAEIHRRNVMVSDKRLYFIIGAAILAVVAVVLVAFLAVSEGQGFRDLKFPPHHPAISKRHYFL
jgi:nitrogen fixation-related uncharacterized protein